MLIVKFILLVGRFISLFEIVLDVVVIEVLLFCSCVWICVVLMVCCVLVVCVCLGSRKGL